jgi:glycerophosphoryl diester phosphodiesterase
MGASLVVMMCAAAGLGPLTSAQAMDGRCADVRGYAHRGGDIGAHSRNTLPKFRDAFAAGMDALETDVRPTKDLDLVIFHDRAVDGVTDGTGAVDDLSTAYIESLHTRDGGRIPSYQRFLRLLVNKPGKHAIVEVKPSVRWTSELFRTALVQPVLNRGLSDRVIFSSDVNRYLPTIDAIHPSVETAVKGASQRTAEQVLTLADSVTTNAGWPAEYVRQIQAADGQVFLSSGRIRGWRASLSKGADGIVSNNVTGLIAWCG